MKRLVLIAILVPTMWTGAFAQAPQTHENHHPGAAPSSQAPPEQQPTQPSPSAPATNSQSAQTGMMANCPMMARGPGTMPGMGQAQPGIGPQMPMMGQAQSPMMQGHTGTLQNN
jgi:hypothetical protein